MAINLTENINHSGGGYIVSVGQSKGSWQSLANKSAFDAFTANSTTKQNLSNGQFFYVLDESQLYRLQVSGVGPFATYTLVSASFSNINTSSFVTNDQTGSFILASDTGSFVLVSQTSSMNVLSALSASFISDTFISASAARSGFGLGGSTDISALNIFTGSAETSLTALNTATSSYLTSDVTASFVNTSQTSSMSVLNSVTASYINPSFISASAAAAGFGVGGSTDISALNIFTGSAQTSLDALNASTSSYIINSQTSSMSVATASYVDPTFISASAAAAGFGNGGSVPVGTISSSQQITDLGFISSSHTDITALNIFTGSIQTQVDSLTAATSSYLTSLSSGVVSSSAQTIANLNGSGILSGSSNIPTGTVSSSVQTIANLVGKDVVVNSITAETYIISSSVTYLTTLFSSGSTIFGDDVNDTHQFTGSLFVLGNVTALSFTGSLFGTSSWALNAVSSSYIDPTFISASAAAAGFGSGGGGSTDITALNNFTGSAQTSLTALNAATSSYITNSQTSSMTVLSASYAENGVSGDGSITTPNWNISADGVITLAASSPTTATSGSIYYDGTNFYFGV